MNEIESDDLWSIPATAATVDSVMGLKEVWPNEKGTGAVGLCRILRVISAAMLAMAFAVLCVIAYHTSYGAEIYRRGQEHAAAEISMAARRVGAAIAFQYEDDMLCVVMLRTKGSYKQARKTGDRVEKRKEILSYNH
jgi:hypothetical protein